MSTPKVIVSELLADAGVEVGGNRPWDIHVHDDRLYSRMLADKNLGLGEGYMQGWWNCERVDQFIEQLVRSGAADRVRGGFRLLLGLVPAMVTNLQSKARSKIVAERHYNLGNDLFQSFLDPYMQYSCAYFNGSDELDDAQRNKMRLICDKLNLRPGDRVLDIGCGWGGLARYMAEHHDVSVVGVNISREQIDFGRRFCSGLPVEIRNCDYRDMNEQFDRIVSVGMFEHVGCRNYRTFMETAHRCLKPEGVFLLHTIGSNISSPWVDPWISKYIFPNGCLPSVAQLSAAAEGLFVVEDWHNFGPHYDTTLLKWLGNFRESWPELKKEYGSTFRRMWEYYLQSCAGAFRARDIQLWQVVLTPEGAGQPCCRVV